mmetsp:Transcript_48019/g.88407  ORF Transcript_48019/g.88407 Transcript_48019/m.88407 type:complete len:250 (+) Transcript_48019:633-1382(+)
MHVFIASLRSIICALRVMILEKRCSSGEPWMVAMNWIVASFCCVKNHFKRSPTYLVFSLILVGAFCMRRFTITCSHVMDCRDEPLAWMTSSALNLPPTPAKRVNTSTSHINRLNWAPPFSSTSMPGTLTVSRRYAMYSSKLLIESIWSSFSVKMAFFRQCFWKSRSSWSNVILFVVDVRDPSITCWKLCAKVIPADRVWCKMLSSSMVSSSVRITSKRSVHSSFMYLILVSIGAKASAKSCCIFTSTKF